MNGSMSASRDRPSRRSVAHPANTDPGRWKRVRREVLERDRYTCQSCGRKGGRLAVDHIRAVRYSGGDPELLWSPSNLQVLCDGPPNYCHRAKTATEQRPEPTAHEAAWAALVDELREGRAGS